MQFQDEQQPHAVEITQQHKPKSTIDQPISATLKRDLFDIGQKILYVLKPSFRQEQGKGLARWDLWGPLIIYLLQALVLALINPTKTKAQTIFVSLFVINWLGSFFITVNAKMLKAKLSFMQTLCLVGYCQAPLAISTLLAALLHLWLKKTPARWVTLGIMIAGLIWSSMAGVAAISRTIQSQKKIMAGYPIALQFCIVCWYCSVI